MFLCTTCERRANCLVAMGKRIVWKRSIAQCRAHDTGGVVDSWFALLPTLAVVVVDIIPLHHFRSETCLQTQRSVNAFCNFPIACSKDPYKPQSSKPGRSLQTKRNTQPNQHQQRAQKLDQVFSIATHCWSVSLDDT